MTAQLRFMERHSFGTEVTCVEAAIGEGLSDITARSSSHNFLHYVTDFLRSYDMYFKNFKLSPFDQRAWDQMLWEYWKSKQRIFIVEDDISDEPASGEKSELDQYLPSRGDRRSINKSVSIKTLTDPSISANDSVSEELTSHAFHITMKEVESRLSRLASLPPHPVDGKTKNLIGTITGPVELIERKTAQQSVLSGLSPTLNDPVLASCEVEWGTPVAEEPVENRKPSGSPVTRTGGVTINGILIGNFAEYVSGENVTLGSGMFSTTLEVKIAAEAPPEPPNEQHSPELNQRPVLGVIISQQQSSRPTSNTVVEVTEDISDSEVMEDFGEKTTFDESKMPWATTLPGANRKIKSSAKSSAKTPPPLTQKPGSDRPLTPRKRTRAEQKLARDIVAGHHAITFLSMALIKVAAWISACPVSQSLEALRNKQACYRFLNGKWKLEMPSEVKKVPRAMVSIFSQICKSDGSPSLIRAILLEQPDGVSFSTWFTAELQCAVAATIEKVIQDCGGNDSQAMYHKWLETGTCQPRITSVKDLLRSVSEGLGGVTGATIQLTLSTSSHDLFQRTNTNGETRGVYAVEGEILSTEQLLEFYGDLLASFPVITSLTDPLSPHDIFGQKRLEEVIKPPCKLFSTRSSSDLSSVNFPHRHIEIGPQTLVSQISEDVDKAKGAQKLVIICNNSGVSWSSGLFLELATGLGCDFIAFDGFVTRPQKKIIGALQQLESRLRQI